MNILITGGKGFVGKNLEATLENIRLGKDKTRSNLTIERIFVYDIDTDPSLLGEFCKDADFVFNLAGVNRPKDQKEFMSGNVGFASVLLDTLRRCNNPCPVMLSSSIQATLIGWYGESDYGKSKKAGEEIFFRYEQETGVPVLVYRFPNLFGKWCRPNYNSVVTTFCYNIAHGLPIHVDDPATELELLYIDDLLEEMLDALEGKAHRCTYSGTTPVPDAQGMFCYAPVTHRVTLGEIVKLLNTFAQQSRTLMMPATPDGSFAQKLYSTFVSYLPREAASVRLRMHEDTRGSFTELLKPMDCGQVSVNVMKPGITKGEHWHQKKWEIFIVVGGKGRIQQRKIGTDEVLIFDVSGDQFEAVYIMPGYIHNIINLSKTENLVTVMWANELFDPDHPDTFYEKVEQHEPNSISK